MGDTTSQIERPLCVELDGTLITSQTMWESILAIARSRPAQLFLAPWWLAGGIASFKRQLGRRTTLNPQSLPYRQDLLDHLRTQADAGRKLILTTDDASEVTARAIARHLGLFDDVISRGQSGGPSLAQAIHQKLGHGEFDYVGHAATDASVWAEAKEGLIVGGSEGDHSPGPGPNQPKLAFAHRTDRPGDLLRSMRIKQWSKNLLLIVPMLVGHRLQLDHLADNLLRFLTAFMAFGCCASSVYLINDLIDLEADRRHPRKKLRPLAMGRVRIPTALLLAMCLLATGLVLGTTLLSLKFAATLLIYMVLSISYCLHFKRMLLLDVIVLAGLYTHRIVAGGVALLVWPLTPWLLAFATFLFLSLAFVKRFSELVLANGDLARDVPAANGRNYTAADTDLIRSVGPASGYLAVLVFCLYINSDDVAKLYQAPQVLWGACPILFYWITRVWFLAERKVLKEDPVLFALYDKASYLSGLLILLILMLAKFWP